MKRANWAALLLFATIPGGPASATTTTIDRDFLESFPASPGARLELRHGDGDVEVERWDRDEIEVSVRYLGEFKTKGLASKPDFDVVFTPDGNTVRVEGRETGAKGLGFFFNHRHEYVYRIKAPGYVELDTRGDDGDVEIADWRGSIEIALDDGDVRLEDVQSESVKIKAEDGDIVILGFGGSLDIGVDDGDVEVADCEPSNIVVRAEDGDVVIDRCQGDFEIAVDDGSVVVTRASASRIDVRSADGDIDLELLAATDLDLYVNADDGDVSLTMAPEISAAFSIDTDDGDIRVSSPEWVLTRRDDRVTGRIGTGEGRIRITTSDGSVTLR